MTNEKEHITPGHDNDGFFGKTEVPYKRSKEEVWDVISEKITERPAAPMVTMARRLIIAGIAASLLTLIGITSFLRFYTAKVTVPNGRHLSYFLPDSSEVELNAQSTLTYNPYWWSFKRNVNLEGEAFFKVKEGNKFTVRSANGITEVLGTSFNIYSRNEDYRVACITGQVRVKSNTDEAVVLGPGYQAEISPRGSISVEKRGQPEVIISWTDNMFNFTRYPFMEVIAEVERQYDITIIVNEPLDLTYTGFFSKEKDAEEVLEVLCKPFGLTFVEKSDGVYQILNNQ